MSKDKLLKAIEEKYKKLGVPLDSMLEGLLWSPHTRASSGGLGGVHDLQRHHSAMVGCMYVWVCVCVCVCGCNGRGPVDVVVVDIIWVVTCDDVMVTS